MHERACKVCIFDYSIQHRSIKGVKARQIFRSVEENGDYSVVSLSARIYLFVFSSFVLSSLREGCVVLFDVVLCCVLLWSNTVLR